MRGDQQISGRLKSHTMIHLLLEFTRCGLQKKVRVVEDVLDKA